MPSLEPVNLEVRSPAPKGLPGLDIAEAKLTAMLARLNQINALLSKPAEIRIGFNNANAALTAIRARATELGRNLKNFKPIDIADMFGFDRNRFLAMIANAEAEITRHTRRKGRRGVPAINTSTGEFNSPEIAARATMLMSRELARETGMALSEFLKQSWQPPVAPTAAAGPGPAPSGPRAAQPPPPPPPGGSGAGRGPGTPSRPPGSPGGRFPTPPPGAQPLDIKEILPADASRDLNRIRRYVLGVGDILRTYSKADQVGGPEELQRAERTVSRVTPALRALRASMADAQTRLMEMQARAGTTPQELVAFMRAQSARLESASKQIRAEGLDLDPYADKALLDSRRMLRDAARLERSAARSAETRDRREAQARLEAARAAQGQSIARGDVGARLALANSLEETLSAQASSLTPRDVARVRGQIGRLRGSDEARTALANRTAAMETIARADAELAGALQRGGLDAAQARETAAAARRALLAGPGGAALSGRERARLQGQAARMEVQGGQALEGAVARDVRGRLDTAWTAAQQAVAQAGAPDQRAAARTLGALRMRDVLERNGAQLDELERNQWNRRIASMEGNARVATDAYRARSRREAEQSGRARSGLQRTWAEANARREREAREAQEQEARRAERIRSVAAAQGLIESELQSGGRITGREQIRVGGRVTGQRITTERETPDGVRRYSVAFTDAGAKVQEFERGLKATRAELGAAGRDFFRNTITVTAWAASVGALYGTLGLLRRQLTAFSEIDLGIARLAAVFRGASGEVQGLADDVLRLAAIEGRSSQEALDSAIRWSRVGYTRAEVAQATRVSLQAANVAEITAEEATERLMGVTAAYNLRARDLDDTLAMLNETSNTWNVSNADLLNGLTRTASVARLAKVPLAELIGIIGAAVGQTGQSGANIGNAIKSVITRLSSPELQGRLRDNFQFEVMLGEGDLAPASTILRDLFLAYQRFNGEQRQSLLYFVAGRTQASRMAAVLDSYVQSQVLAINAQLNLNSAEEENLRIRESLHNQLRGLVTEFERFTAMQMTLGPMGTSLKQAAESLRNVLRLGSELTAMGGSTGAWIGQGMMGLGALVAARLAVTGVQMRDATRSRGGLAGFVGSSVGRVAGAGVALANTVDAATTSFMHGRWGLMQREGSQTFTGRAAGGLMHAEGIFSHTAEARGRLARMQILALRGEMTALGRAGVVSSIAWNRSLAAVSITARGLLMTLRATLIAVRSLFMTVAVPMAGIAAAAYGFNRLMDRMGLSINGVTRELESMEQTADAAAAAAAAADMAIRLADTVQQAMTINRDPSERARMLKQLSEVSAFSQGGRETFAGAATGTVGDEAVDAALEEEKVLLRNRATRERIAEVEANRNQITKARTDRDRLIAIQESGAWLGRESRQKNIDVLTQRIARTNERNLSLMLEENEALEKRMEMDQRFLQMRQAFQVSAKGFGSIIEATPTVMGDAGRAVARVVAIQAENDARDRQIELAEAAAKQAMDDQSARDEIMRKEEESIKSLRLQIADLDAAQLRSMQLRSQGLGPGGALTGDSAIGQQRDKLFAELQRREQEFMTLANTPTGEQERLMQNLRQARKDRKEGELPEQLARQEAPFAILRSEINQLGELTRSRLGGEDVGADAAERVQNRLAAAERLLDVSRLETETAATAQGQAEAMVRRLAAIQGVQDALLDRQRLMVDLRRQEFQIVADARRELERTLLTAGPADMVRRMAAARLGQGGVSGSQFLSAAPSMREELARLFPESFNTDILQARRARRTLEQGGGGMSDTGIIAQLRGILIEQGEVQQMLRALLPGASLVEESGNAALRLSAVAESANAAALALQMLPQAIQALMTGGGGGLSQAQGDTGM